MGLSEFLVIAGAVVVVANMGKIPGLISQLGQFIKVLKRESRSDSGSESS